MLMLCACCLLLCTLKHTHTHTHAHARTHTHIHTHTYTHTLTHMYDWILYFRFSENLQNGLTDFSLNIFLVFINNTLCLFDFSEFLMLKTLMLQISVCILF